MKDCALLTERAAYDAALRASRDAQASRDSAYKAAHSAITAAILAYQQRCKISKCGDEIKAASDAYDKAVDESHNYYQRACKYANKLISKSRKAQYALNSATRNKSDYKTK